MGEQRVADHANSLVALVGDDRLGDDPDGLRIDRDRLLVDVGDAADDGELVADLDAGRPLDLLAMLTIRLPGVGTIGKSGSKAAGQGPRLAK